MAGDYVVEEVLATQPASRVYRARRPGRPPVALKELLFTLVPDVDAIDAFEREAAILQSLCHPGVPRYVGHFGEGEGPALRLYLAQEHIEGVDLETASSLGPMLEEEVVQVVTGALRILDYVHGFRVLHRDVKPANLMLTPQGRLVLVDFGVAWQGRDSATRHGTGVGTVDYMAYEQLGGKASPRSDVYSLGATALRLLSGLSPSELRLPGTMELVVDARVSASRPVAEVLRRMVRFHDKDRYASAADALRALEQAQAKVEAARSVNSSVPSKPPGAALAAPGEGFPWKPVLGLAFLGIMAHASATWAVQHPAPPPPPPPAAESGATFMLLGLCAIGAVLWWLLPGGL